MRAPNRLSYEEIERKATDLLFEFGKGNLPGPLIPVQTIVEEYLGLSLFIGSPADIGQTDDVLGAIFFEDNEVFLNEKLLHMEGRFNFTLAHETGHDQMHRGVVDPVDYLRPLFGHPRRFPGVICRDGDRSILEWQADVYASCLLMPRTLLHNAVTEVAKEQEIWHDGRRFVYSPTEGAGFIGTLAQRFQVSRQAMRYRLDKVDLTREGEPRQIRFVL